jgi:hypothetical protein
MCGQWRLVRTFWAKSCNEGESTLRRCAGWVDGYDSFFF